MAVVVCAGVVIVLWGHARRRVWDAKDEPGRGLPWAWNMKIWIDIGALIVWIVLLVMWFFPGRTVRQSVRQWLL